MDRVTEIIVQSDELSDSFTQRSSSQFSRDMSSCRACNVIQQQRTDKSSSYDKKPLYNKTPTNGVLAKVQQPNSPKV